MKQLIKRYFSILLALVLLTAGLSMSPRVSETVSAAASSALNLKTVALRIGQSTSLRLSNASGKITWKSSDTSIASVNANGKVTAKKAGTAVITAVNRNKNYNCVVTAAAKSTKTLIVYFSWGGETKKAASRIAKAINADIVRIKPKKAYSKDYNTVVKTARQELNSSARPAVATSIKNIGQYDTILTGYPIWHGDAPMLIRTFLENYNLRGKTVIPFCTSAGSGISGSMSSIRSSAKGANVVNGRDLTDNSLTQIKSWLNRVMPDTSQDTENSSGTEDSNTGDSSNNTDTNTGSDNKNPADTGNSSDSGSSTDTENTGKLLIAYFSWSGTSEKQALSIAAQTGGDLYRIERQTPYSSDYNTVAYGEAKDEADTNARPPLLNPLPSIDGYEKTVLCYPIWWHTAPMTVGTFLEAYDWSGKTIYPISQSASMSVSQYEESLAFIKGCAKNASVDNGLFTKSDSEITDYIKNTVLK